MRKLPWFIVLVLFLVAAAPPIYTPWKAFFGSGGITVTTNPVSGTVTIDGTGIAGGTQTVVAAFGNMTLTNVLTSLVAQGGYSLILGSAIEFNSTTGKLSDSNGNRRITFVYGGGATIYDTQNLAALYIDQDGNATFAHSISATGASSTILSLTMKTGQTTNLFQAVDTNGVIQSKLDTNFVFTSLLKPPSATATRAAVIGPDGILTNALGTPTGTKFLRDDNTYAVPPGGSGTPGGAFPQLQFNDTGAVFAGTTNWSYHSTNGSLVAKSTTTGTNFMEITGPNASTSIGSNGGFHVGSLVPVGGSNIVAEGTITANGGGTNNFGPTILPDLRLTNAANSLRAPVGGTICVSNNPIANAGTAQTNLITFSVPAHTLTNNGDRIEFKASGRFAANTDAKELLVILGSQTIWDSTSQIVNSGSWSITGEIIRTGNTGQSCWAAIDGAGLSLFTDATAADLTQTNGVATTLAIAATCAGSGDCTNRTLTITYYPAP